RENLSGENPRRWRIEHCQVVDPADMDYFSRYSIIPSVQPTHATSDMYWAEERLGKDRMTGAYAYRSLEREAETIAFGTDFPVERINPLLTFYAAVSRKDLEGNPPDGFRAEEAMKRKDVLKAMTTWAAYANFEEEEKGLIDNGYFADFIVLDRNIMEIDEEQIPQTRVLSTYVNGELVYGAE
ncbi:MAG TPA: amidohydrolase family protein, partial [Bacteroidia bacterium]|nr:amidohydrolase family protein [Bacteroidia bacterium]